MSKDEPDRKRSEDPSYVTMPPELRPFANPTLENKVQKPGENPLLAAAVAAIKVLDQGEKDADAFFYDVKKAQVAAKKDTGIGNTSAYVAPTGVPGAPEPEAQEATAEKVVLANGTAAPDAAPASPWSNGVAPSEPLRASALPSSLMPRDTPAPAGAKPTPGRTRAAVTTALVLALLALGLAAAWRMSQAPESTPQPAPTVPAPTVRAAAPPALEPPATSHPTPSASAAAPTVAPLATTAPRVQRVAPKPSSALEDPYDASAPIVKTATPVVAPPATAAPVAPAPPKSASPPPGPTPMFEREKGS